MQGKRVVNSISLKEGEEEFVARRVAPPLRRRGRRDGVRRERPGRHARAQDRDLHRRSYDTGRKEGRLPAGRHHLRSEHLRRSRPASKSTTTTAMDFIEATRWIKQASARTARSRRRLQRFVFVPRQRPRARSDPRGVPVSRDPRRPDDGHRQRRSARRVRRDPDGVARARRRRDVQPPPRCHRALAGDCRDEYKRQRRQGVEEDWNGARAGRGASRRTRWCKGINAFIVADTEEARQQVPSDRSR